jgi:hypothetical protein
MTATTATAKKFTKAAVRAIKPGTWVVIEVNGGPKDPKGVNGAPARKREIALLLQTVGKAAAETTITVWLPPVPGFKYVAWDRVVDILNTVEVPPLVASIKDVVESPNKEATVTGKVPAVLSATKVPTPDWPFGGKTLDNVPAPASAMKAGKVVKTSQMKTAMKAAVNELQTALDKKVAKAVGKKPKAKVVKKVEKVRAKVVKGIKKDLKANELAKGKKVATKRIQNAKFA